MEWVNNIKDSLEDLRKIGHHVPLQYLTLVHGDQADQVPKPILNNLSEPIRVVPFSDLLGKNLFGIQPITECDSCCDYYKNHKCIHDPVRDHVYMWDCSLCYKVSKYVEQLDLSEHNTIKDILMKFVEVKWSDPTWDATDSEDSSSSEDSDMSDYYERNGIPPPSEWIADLHPRLWLFVGDSIGTFKNYLLFNSEHGHPHMDNWNLVEWNLTQPPATDKLKVISSVINNIKLYDDDWDIHQHRYRADLDKWVKYSGVDQEGYEVPSKKPYPMIRIDTDTKLVGLGAQWTFCHYPRSIWRLLDKKRIDRLVREKEEKEARLVKEKRERKAANG